MPSRYLGLALQLGLIALVVRLFRLENPLFYERIMPLVVAGFLVHYLLPPRYRLPFFVALSLFGFHLGLGLVHTLWLVGLGLALISLCHLPLPFALRVALVAACGAALALLRVGRFQAAWAASVVPVLASLFMFRIVVYLYDLKHQKQAASLPHTLAYFFLLPNLVFTIFPIVDYTTFRSTYNDRDRHE